MKNSYFVRTAVILLVAGLLVSCSNFSRPPISVSISAASLQTDQGQSVAIRAMVGNDPASRGVIWSLAGPGSLSAQNRSSVTYVAPPPSNNTTVQTATISAVSGADQTKSTSVQIVVNPLPSIRTFSLPDANAGISYHQSLQAWGGTAPFSWTITYGAMPPELSIAGGSGSITGTPTLGGTWYFWVQITDAVGVQALPASLSLAVQANVTNNPKPFLNQPVMPASAVPGGPGFVLLLLGTGFIPSSTVLWNNTPLTTTFFNGQQLAAAVPAAQIATAGTASIKVLNPTPGGGGSNEIYFPVALPEADVSFSEAAGSPIPVRGGASHIVAGDFRENGMPDLSVTQDGAYTYIFLANGDGTFHQPAGSPLQIQKPPWNNLLTPLPDFVITGDFNNSGKLGMAVASDTNGNVSVFLGNGDGTFTASSAFVYTAGQPTRSIAAGDFRNSGNLDLVATNTLGLPVNILLGYGDGAFNQAPLSANGSMTAATMAAVGDFNGDGKLDIAITGGSVPSPQNEVTILLGNGDGSFSLGPNPVFTTGTAPQAIAAADLNNDGKLDLVIANSQGSSLTILLGAGDGTFTPAAGSPVAVGNEPIALALADLNGDGKLDLAVANLMDNTVTILLGNGDGTFVPSSTSPVAVGQWPISIAIGDFNSSGRLGLAVANLLGNSVSIFVQQP